MGKYFYGAYEHGFNHRSNNATDAAKHVADDERDYGARGRLVVMVEGSYFPPRANDKRGTLNRFLLANEITAVGGTLPTWIADRIAAASTAATTAATAADTATATLPAVPTFPAYSVAVRMPAWNVKLGRPVPAATAPIPTTAAATDTADDEGTGTLTAADRADLDDRRDFSKEARMARIEERASARRIRAMGQK